MILKHFPGQSNSDRAKDFDCFHRENIVVYAKSTDISFTEHTAPLSVKTCLSGKEIYELNRIPITVEANKSLVINNDQLYASYIFSTEETDSFCIFFRDGIESEVLTAMASSNQTLLADPEFRSVEHTEFFSTLLYENSYVTRFMTGLHRSILVGGTTQLWLDEKSNELVELLIREQCGKLKEIKDLPFVKISTKLEIFKRLSISRDYIESCYADSICLKKLSRVSCLSQHHFLRLFKSAFRLTPHQYLTEVRLKRAHQLLQEPSMTVTEVCFEVGFSDPSSFTRLFKRRFGQLPSDLKMKS